LLSFSFKRRVRPPKQLLRLRHIAAKHLRHVQQRDAAEAQCPPARRHLIERIGRQLRHLGPERHARHRTARTDQLPGEQTVQRLRFAFPWLAFHRL
jgi:hypothetical protein